MASVPTARATFDDLYREEGKAELIGGRIIRFMASGDLPSSVAFEIATQLKAYAKATGIGKAYADGTGFAVPELTSERESFTPDASYHAGVPATNRMRFIQGPPTFAVEVRSENDYGPTADQEYADKRRDYFEAGTLVVWDVDPLARTITSHRDGQPPIIFRNGDTADAEPAVPGWRVAVDDVFAV